MRKAGPVIEPYEDPTTIRPDNGRGDPVAVVYASWGLWVADCPRDGCQGTAHYGHTPGITTSVGNLTDRGFLCSRCGLACEARWPGNARDIEAVLSARPLIETRSWRPGETLEDLVVENALHGIQPAELFTGGITIIDNQFTDRAMLTGSRRAMIGGA